MTDFDAQLKALREALQVSPQNTPLRRHVAQLLLDHGDLEGAEAEFRRAMKMDPADAGVQLGLARAFHAQGKNELAMMILEDHLLSVESPAAESHLIHARVLLASGRSQDALEAYRAALKLNPSLADAELSDRLGADAVPAGGDSPKDLPAQIDSGRVRVPSQKPDESDPIEILERPSVNFASVGGMEKLKEEIRLKIILPLTNKDLYAAYGKKIGGGILMYGPPGCGKTHLARATAGEIRSAFMAVGVHDVLDMWLGESERKLHQIFEQARRNAPCVLFFDEVDALAASRSDLRKSAGRNVINQFLSEMDGAQSANDGVLILAATNAPWHMDSAFRRPGRFDRILFVPPPDAPARAEILKLHLAGKPVESINHAKLADKMQEFSGADLKSAVDLAVEAALQEAMKKGKPLPIDEAMLLKAAKQVRPSAREWFASARNHAIYANESGIYDDVLAYLKIK